MARGFRDEDRDDDVTFDKAIVIHYTDKAILCEIDDTRHWVPESQIRPGSEICLDNKADNPIGTMAKLVISNYIAGKLGLAE